LPDWTDQYDFDADGRADHVEVAFSGGAHCCYTLALHTANGRTIALPFELDGGYVLGLDLSRPDHFDVRVDPDGAYLVLEIQTYNGEPGPIPRAWTHRWGIRSHRIAVRFRGKGFRAVDLPWFPP
jgi:hypothetical protein